MTNTSQRTCDQLKEQYEVEKELANQLRNAKQKERQYLYTSLYNELYRRIPHHPQLTRQANPQLQREVVVGQMRFLKRFLRLSSTFMEVGPGDCSVSLEAAKLAKKVYAVDVSTEITKNLKLPQHFELIISDGCSVPVPENSVSVAYSFQLMEHLHPDDAFEQVQNIYKALEPGGVYICITPNRLSGPHDISKYFDDVATGLHLKEYTMTELATLFESAGFSKIYGYIGVKGRFVFFPIFFVRRMESFLSQLPRSLSKRIADHLFLRLLLSVILVAGK